MSSSGAKSCPTACNLCGNDGFRHLFDETCKSGYTCSVVRCEKCRLVFTNPVPNEDFLLKLYSHESYKRNTVSGIYCLDEKINSVDHRYVLKHLKRLCNGKRLLDVGCGIGSFVRSALDVGWDAYGVEPSPYVGELARATLGNCISVGFLKTLDFEKESFDAITLWYVLEHVTDPTDFLRDCNYLLKTDGCIFVAVPNVKYMMLRRRVERVTTGKLGSVYAHEHLFQFTPRTLEGFLQKTGFTMVLESTASPYMVSSPGINKLKRLLRLLASAFLASSGISLGGILMFARKRSLNC